MSAPRNRALPRRALAALALLALPLTSAADPPAPARGDYDLPLPVPERPFLLLEAPRRFSPREPAQVHIQQRESGPVDLAVLRVNDPERLLAGGPTPQGVATAATPLGAELEALVQQSSALPRRGASLTLVATPRVTMPPPRRAARRPVASESTAYDSNETDEGGVETWGVNADAWAELSPSLGPLPPGLYLVRAHNGAWGASALLSVGELVLLARRGDAHDALLATDGEGRPLAGVEIAALEGGVARARVRTGADGQARLPASDAPALRFVARRGDDVAWADVTHARLAPCDVRVYLATGRPVFRPGEPAHVRGHVRGCPAGSGGGGAPLRDEPVRVGPTGESGQGETTVRTDADGNFTAVLTATHEGVHATVRGREHRRTIQLDARALPRRALRVALDRAWAAAGETVHVRVADDDGGWPVHTAVEIELPTGRVRAPIGPRLPAEATYTVPSGTRATLERVAVHATLAASGVTTFAAADLWIGRQREVLELTSAQTYGTPNAPLGVVLRAADLGGAPAPGAVQLTVRATDGNNPSGLARWSSRAQVDPTGQLRANVTLAGNGPWWIEARRGEGAEAPAASLVVWERPRPPALSQRGDLAVQPAVLRAAPGASLPVDLRAPAAAGGATWLTLEQGSVWSSALVAAASTVRGASGVARVPLAVPDGARGLASIVATHVRGGQVSTASAVAEVATSTALALALETDKRVYGGGETAHVTVHSRAAHDGSPRDAVLSLWLADAGYWELGTEDYPTPDEVFRLPGRRASAGDSTRPLGYGAEEGRHLDTLLEWNGRPLARASFRHAWGHGGALVTLDARGRFDAVADALARAAGLSGARVCAERARSLGAVALRARNLPWDLVALRVADETRTYTGVRGGVLLFDCDEPGSLGLAGVGATGSGAGYGSGYGGLGSSARREQTLEGTLLFIGTRRIGPSGRLALDIPLPDHPGRWRIQALAIADDGGGNSADATVSTTRPIEARVDLPARMRVGDEAEGELSVYAPAFANQDARVSVTLPAPLSPLPTQLRIGADGWARAPFVMRASASGTQRVGVEVRVGRQADSVQRSIEVADDIAAQPLAVRTVLGPEATAVDVPLPELAEPASLRVQVDSDLAAGIDEALAELRAPRWDVAPLRVDRLASLRALEDAVGALPAAARGERATQVARAVASETAALAALRSADGAAAWWTGMRSSTRLTAELLWVLGPDVARGATWAAARDVVRRRVAAAASEPVGADAATLLAAAAVLARDGDAADRALALALAQRAAAPGRERVAVPLEEAVWALRVARALRDPALVRAGAAAARAAITAVVDGAQDPSAATCRGVAWFLCFGRLGDRAMLARAAAELATADAASAPLAGRVVHYLATHLVEARGVHWGTAEADVMALTARVGPPRAVDTRFEVHAGGRLVARGDGRAPVLVVVPRGVPVRVTFAAAAGRAARVRVEGELRVQPRAQPAGPVPLSRQVVVTHGGARELLVEFAPPRDLAGVELSVPLPAGFELARAAGASGAARVRDDSVESWVARWRELDHGPAETRPVVERADGGVVLRFARVRAGRHAVRLPLAASARGRYRAGPAVLRVRGDAAMWAVTPALEAEVRDGASTPAPGTAVTARR